MPIETLYVLEIFCGAGRLCGAIRRLGLSDSLGIDSTVHKNLSAPILRLDLTSESSVQLVARMMEQSTLCYIHFGPPCGTASRARQIVKAGQFNPAPARSDRFPDGLLHLKGSLKLRVTTANKLYAITGYLFAKAWKWGILSSVENPGRSFFWATSFWNNFTEEVQYLTTYFHHCCYVSQQRKLTRLFHTLPLLEELCATCPGESPEHVHLPWGQAADGHFATSEETAYPLPLCKAWAHLVYEQLIALGAIGVPQQLDEFRANPIRAAKVLAEQESVFHLWSRNSNM